MPAATPRREMNAVREKLTVMKERWSRLKSGDSAARSMNNSIAVDAMLIGEK
jgi:hypothetical protein